MTTTTWLGAEVVLISGCECCGKLKQLSLVSDPDGNKLSLCDDCNPEME